MNILSKGIDISHWQGDFDLAQAKAEGFEFVIIKGGGADDGLYVDSRFEENYRKAKELDMPTGCYWFSRALSVKEAIAEADYFHEKCLKGRLFELPVYMDVEHERMFAFGKEHITEVIHAFCQRLEALGYWVGIYSGLYAFKRGMNDSELQRYAHWVACWDTGCNYDSSAFGMWQYGGETNLICSNKVAGVVCDQNYMLVDYPSLIKAKGLNGWQQPQDGDVSDSDTEREEIPVSDSDTGKEENSDVPDYLQKEGAFVMVFSKAADGDTYLTPNFQVNEFACQDGSDPVFIHPQIPIYCQLVRDKFGYPFTPNSAYRTVSHNASPAVGGAARSFHVYGLAVDIPALNGTTPQQLYDFFEELLGDSGELGIYSWGVHVAVTNKKNRFRG